jgi:hypothetical protein
MRGIAEVPGGTVVDLGFTDDKAGGAGFGGGFEVTGEGGEFSGGAMCSTALVGAPVGVGGGRSRGRDRGSDSRHGDHVLFKRGRFPSDGIFLVVGNLESKEDS